jgi:replicative DNA helicase
MKENMSNVYRLYITMFKLYDKYKDKHNINNNELLVEYNLNYNVDDNEELQSLINRIYSIDVSNKESIIQLLDKHKEKAIAGDIAKLALDVEDGRATRDTLLTKLKELDTTDSITVSKHQDMDLDSLYQSQIASPGLRWRTNWLNQSLGSLRLGDFGFIYARPEVGKTTFLANEISHMVGQSDGNVLWFNNEEQSQKVAIRCYQAYFGITTKELFANVDKYKAKYQEEVGDKIQIFDLDDSSSTHRIESIVAANNPSLIIIDQLDKVRGFKADRHDLQMKSLYQWAREIAKRHAPVIAVCQAGGSAEGKAWLDMNDVDSSKTAKQGEGDWLMGIGSEADAMSNSRYLKINKNKLIGDKDTDPTQRHGNRAVLIQPDIARFKEL